VGRALLTFSVPLDDSPEPDAPSRLGASPAAALTQSMAYEQRVSAARRMVGDNSRQVAQVVKNWVSEDG
jgi:flagellar M-ring protein FliF